MIALTARSRRRPAPFLPRVVVVTALLAMSSVVRPLAAQQPPLPQLPPALKVPDSYEGLFAERDQRARGALGFLECMEGTARAARSGTAGTINPAWSIACVQERGEWRGIFAELIADEPGARVHRQFAVRAGRMVSSPVDTVNVSRIARAMRRALSVPVPSKGQTSFAPIVLAQPSFTEIWFIPLPDATRLVAGGDSIIQMTMDGNRELGHARRTPPLRPLAVTPGKPFVLESTEARIPLVSELMAAHLALETVTEVRVRTNGRESVLRRGATRWLHP
jgi:hypothetical protein